MPIVDPLGGNAPVVSGTRAQQVREIEGLITDRTGNPSYGQEYAAFAASHPSLAAKEAYLVWWVEASGLGGNLGKDIATGIDASGQLGKDGAIGTAEASKTPLSGIDAIGAFFSQLGSRELWVRIGKVVIGMAMIIVGLNKMTGGKIEAVAGKIPPVIPV